MARKRKPADGETWTELKPSDVGPMVYGDGLTYLARLAYEKGDLDGAVGCMAANIPARTFVDILLKRADIVGNDRDGFSVVYRSKIAERKANRELSRGRKGGE